MNNMNANINKAYIRIPLLLSEPYESCADETKDLLVATAQEAWNLLDWKHLETLSATIPHRVEAIIESRGWYTSY